MAASGTLALDRQLQPLAAMSVKIQGYVPALDQLRATGVVGPRELTIAKLVLGALSRQELEGGPATVRLPVNIQDGFLTLSELKRSLRQVRTPATRWAHHIRAFPLEIL